jgi:hypothetical protein
MKRSIRKVSSWFLHGNVTKLSILFVVALAITIASGAYAQSHGSRQAKTVAVQPNEADTRNKPATNLRTVQESDPEKQAAPDAVATEQAAVVSHPNNADKNVANATASGSDCPAQFAVVWQKFSQQSTDNGNIYQAKLDEIDQLYKSMSTSTDGYLNVGVPDTKRSEAYRAYQSQMGIITAQRDAELSALATQGCVFPTPPTL